MTTPLRPRVLVTVGTDHHPFDRLMGWVDHLVSAGTVRAGELLVQAGSSRHPRAASVRTALPRDELMVLMGAAQVVVGHAGPGTIMDARTCGRRPVIVPRIARLGEVVDDHQVAFARRLADVGMIVLAEDLESFAGAVARGLDEPASLAATSDRAAGDDVARALAGITRGLPATPRPRITRRLHDLWRVRRR